MTDSSTPNGQESKQKRSGSPAKLIVIAGISILIVALLIALQSHPPAAKGDSAQSVTLPSDAAQIADPTPEEDIPAQLASPGPPLQVKEMVATDKRMIFVPGALVCPNYETTTLVSDIYQHSLEERLQDAVTGGQSKDVRGESQSAPDPKDYDCILVKPGTRMLLEDGKIVSVVYVQTSKGWIRGITIDAMMITKEQAAKAAADQNAYEEFVKSLQDLKPEFERQVQTLPAPALNLRLYQAGNGTVYVSPFGPCAVLRGDGSEFTITNYDAFALHTWGPFQTQPEAETSAVNLCSQSFAVEAGKQHSQTDYWFPVEDSQGAGIPMPARAM
jgi:hypothetical protein